ncbi:hypothetical protein ACP4OV_020420 [Aristida adscensionis]
MQLDGARCQIQPAPASAVQRGKPRGWRRSDGTHFAAAGTSSFAAAGAFVSPSRGTALADENEDLDKSARSNDIGFHCLLMSVQHNVPHYVIRHKCELLTKRKYFSLRRKWSPLLGGKRTYLRQQSNSCVPDYNCDDNFLFLTPEPLLRTLGCQEPLLDLVHESAKSYIVRQKLKILGQHYELFRRTRRDGSSFYRENLGQMQDSQAEVTRLMECVARCRENFSRLKWDKAYFLNPEAYLTSAISDFKHLVKSVANGLSADELYERSLEEITSIRMLTETEIRTHEEIYKSSIPQQKNALLFCVETVRPMDFEAETVQNRALSYALGIPLRLEVVNTFMRNRVVQAKRVDFFPRSKSGVSSRLGPLDAIESYYPASPIRPPEQRTETQSCRPE